MIDSTNQTVVAIVSDGSRIMAAPGMAPIHAGNQLVFHNLTREAATIIMPDDRIFGTNLFTVDANAQISLTVPENFDLFGSYPYAIYFRQLREFAHASMPIIIIYPKKP
jgi:hypothetical protein